MPLMIWNGIEKKSNLDNLLKYNLTFALLYYYHIKRAPLPNCFGKIFIYKAMHRERFRVAERVFLFFLQGLHSFMKKCNGNRLVYLFQKKNTYLNQQQFYSKQWIDLNVIQQL